MISIPQAGAKLSLAPALAYLAYTLTLWACRIFLDAAYYKPNRAYLFDIDDHESITTGLPREYTFSLILSHLIGMLHLILLFKLCPRRIRRAFCTLLFRGGFITSLLFIDNIKPVGFFIILFGRILCGDASYGIFMFLFREVFVGNASVRMPGHMEVFIGSAVDQILRLAVVLLSVKVQYLPKQDIPDDFTVTSPKEFMFLALACGLGEQIAGCSFFYSLLVSTSLPWWTCLAVALDRAVFMASALMVGASALKLWRVSLTGANRVTLFQFLSSVVWSIFIKYFITILRPKMFSSESSVLSWVTVFTIELCLARLVYYRYTTII